MRTILLVLACSAHRALAHIETDITDEQGRDHAIATLLLAVNPSQALTRFSSRWLRSPRPQVNMALDEDSRPPFQNPGMINIQPVESIGIRPVGSQQLASAVPKNIDLSSSVLIQGAQTLKTWSFKDANVDRVQVFLSSSGRPVDVEVDLWQGPDNTPTKVKFYSEDGSTRPFNAVIETPNSPNSIAVRNMAHLEFPVSANLVGNNEGYVEKPSADFSATSRIVQGQSLKTYKFPGSVKRVEVMLKTDGRPLNARIEMISGPNNNKQVIDVYAEDGLLRPFFTIFDTIGEGYTVRVVNTSPVEFPLHASVEPHLIDSESPFAEPVLG